MEIAFLIVDLTFHGQWNVFPVRCQKPYSGIFARLTNHPGLAIRKGSTVKVDWQGATTVLPSCACNLAHLGRRTIYNFGTASYQMTSSWLASHPSLANRTGSTVEVVLARCHYCSSKLCLQFGPFGPISLQQRQLPNDYIQLWDS